MTAKERNDKPVPLSRKFYFQSQPNFIEKISKLKINLLQSFSNLSFCIQSNFSPLSDHLIIVTLESLDQNISCFDDACSYFCENTKDLILSRKNILSNDILNMEYFLSNLETNETDEKLRMKILKSFEDIFSILETYTLPQIIISFNGGKDCTLALHLLSLCLKSKYPFSKSPIHAFIHKTTEEFSEIEAFINKICDMYNIKKSVYNLPMKESLTQLKIDFPNIFPIIMGTRRMDPTGKYMKSNICETDNDWPKLLRVCPIFDWDYHEVWRVIKALNIPYCSLYDEGYTSLGGKESTHRNEELIKKENGNVVGYFPAYKLKNSEFERTSRRKL
uniref:FAD synthase n=1 Tax=Parastrongyloides trichosuri TaxID=131310 RepID=A0A0N4ZT51_PARTI